MSTLFGAGLGSLVGAFEPKIAAFFAGKSAQEAMTAKPPASWTEAEVQSLTAAQRRIEESLGIGAATKDAGESAVVMSQEHPPVVNSAAESAQVLSEPYKKPTSARRESALNEADAVTAAPRSLRTASGYDGRGGGLARRKSHGPGSNHAG